MALHHSYDESLLFSKIAEGDEQAFTELFHIYTPKLYPFVLKLTRNEHLAQEMIQETFLRLWMNKTDLKAIENPSAWIYRIASNISLTYLRNQGNRRRLIQNVPVNEKEDSAFDILQTKELDLIIQRAINLLPDRRQEMYRLSREEGLTHQQIAERLNLSQNTVKNQIGIALKFIREFIIPS